MMINAPVGNKDILSIGFHDLGALPKGKHNSHIVIIFRAQSSVDREKLLTDCLALEGVVERGSIARKTEVAFGTEEPADPPTTVKALLALLHEKEFLSEKEVRAVYEKFGFEASQEEFQQCFNTRLRIKCASSQENTKAGKLSWGRIMARPFARRQILRGKLFSIFCNMDLIIL